MGTLFSKKKKQPQQPAAATTAAPAPAPITPAPLSAAAPSSRIIQDTTSIIAQANRDPVTNFYDVGGEIGRGGFAVLRKATRKSDGTQVAIKFVDKKHVSGNPDDLQCLRREIDIMKRLDHPNVLKLYDVFETPEEVIMVMELVTGGELFYKIVEKGSFSELDATNIVRQLVTGVCYIHTQKVAHRDLKPENLLCAGDEQNILIKIADFGLSKVFTAGDPLKTQCGTPDYAAPEVLTSEGGAYSDAVDMWAIGVITYVVLCGYPPFYANTITDLFEVIKRGRYEFPPEEWSRISNEAKDFIRRLLIVNPAQRMTGEEALAHPWIKEGSSLERTASVMNLARLREYNVRRKKQAAT